MGHKFVTCASYGGTGSSAITDFLKEFDNVNSMGDYEFTLCHEVGGLSDLQHYLVDDWHRLKVDEGIYRFKKLAHRIEKDYNGYLNHQFSQYTDEYINTLTDCQWNGYWHQQKFRLGSFEQFWKYKLPIRLRREIIKIKQKYSDYELVPYQKRQPMYFAKPDNEFFDLTKKYMEKILSSADLEGKYEYLAFDQLVPTVNVDRYLNYFPNLKVVIVDRDPRDLYILNKKFWNEGWIPTEDVELFIQWFAMMRTTISKEIQNPNVLLVKFEDLIYNYETESVKMMNFIGLNENNHIRRQQFLNPERSKKNTQLWMKYNEYQNDIILIEEKLGQYCYDYSTV